MHGLWPLSPARADRHGPRHGYAQVDKRAAGRNSQRSVTHVTGVSRMAIADRLKKVSAAPPPLPRLRSKRDQHEWWEALELDEIWTLMGRKKRKVWLWLAVERASRIVAWVMGRRGAAPALPEPLLVLYRLVGKLRGDVAPLAAPPLPQRRRGHEHRRGHQRCLAPAVRGSSTQILLL